MSGFNEHKATEAAVQIVAALASAGTLKVNGIPMEESRASAAGKLSGEYIAAMINAIASGITEK